LFIAEGIDVVRHPEPHVGAVTPLAERLGDVAPEANRPAVIVRGAGGVLAASGLLIALGIAPRLGGGIAAAVLGSATAIGPRTRSDVLVKAALTGAALLIAADTSARDARRLAAARHRVASRG
jgi:hypothetical protein